MRRALLAIAVVLGGLSALSLIAIMAFLALCIWSTNDAQAANQGESGALALAGAMLYGLIAGAALALRSTYPES